jgi:hypothetical protein
MRRKEDEAPFVCSCQLSISDRILWQENARWKAEPLPDESDSPSDYRQVKHIALECRENNR